MLSVISSLRLLFFFKQKTAYELRISDWSSDVCSSDLVPKFVWADRLGDSKAGNAVKHDAERQGGAEQHHEGRQHGANTCVCHWPAPAEAVAEHHERAERRQDRDAEDRDDNLTKIADQHENEG